MQQVLPLFITDVITGVTKTSCLWDPRSGFLKSYSLWYVVYSTTRDHLQSDKRPAWWPADSVALLMVLVVDYALIPSK